MKESDLERRNLVCWIYMVAPCDIVDTCPRSKPFLPSLWAGNLGKASPVENWNNFIKNIVLQLSFRIWVCHLELSQNIQLRNLKCKKCPNSKWGEGISPQISQISNLCKLLIKYFKFRFAALNVLIGSHKLSDETSLSNFILILSALNWEISLEVCLRPTSIIVKLL